MNAHATHGAHCACHNCAPELSAYAHPRVVPMRPRDGISRRDTRALHAGATHSPAQPHRPRRIA